MKWKLKYLEKYWWIYLGSQLRICSNNWDETSRGCKNLYDLGNCFRTRKEAMVAVKKIKRVLKGVSYER